MKIGKRNKFPKINNGGYSIIELVVVIGIMAVVLGAATLSLMIVKNGREKKIISSVKSGIGNTRIETLARQETEIKIYAKDGHYYVEQVIKDAVNPSDMSKAKINIKDIGITKDDVLVDGSDLLTTYDDTNPIVIVFDRGTGSVDTANSSNVFTRMDAGHHYVILQQKTGKVLMDKDTGTVPTP